MANRETRDAAAGRSGSSVRRMSAQASTLELLLHPLRLRILQAMTGHAMTTAELAGLFDDVAAATVYRHVNTLLDAGVLTIVSERRVRGAVERTLALVEDAAQMDAEDAAQMSEEQHRQAFTVFLAHQAAEFDRFVTRHDEAAMPLFGYGQTILHLSEDDLGHVQEQLRAVLEPYLRSRGGLDERRVSLATLLIPESTNHND
jgi:DNA-binding transcriptional ArsR family regulator